MTHIIGVDIPDIYTSVDDSKLKILESQLVRTKCEKSREIDHIDTKLIGIREELRKRKEQKLIERTFPSACTQD